MKVYFQVHVEGEKAVAGAIPTVAEGSRGVVYLSVSFDKAWADFPQRKLTLWREGEVMLQFLLDDSGEMAIPSAFTRSEKPFYLRLTGEDGGVCLQTNALCASFGDLRGEGREPAYDVYHGSYRITENGVYPTESMLFGEDLTVDVFTVDTTADTVTPETLHKGVTAHNAEGALIEGTYVNPYNANTEQDTVTPETLHKGVTAHNAEGAPIEGTYVNPYNANTEHDTVTPETLHKGVTAHDAAGAPIEGTYVNPYNANTEEDTVTPETLHKGVTAHNAEGAPIEGTYVNPYNANTEQDTVTPETLHQGITAHNAEGEPIEGTYVPKAGSTNTAYSKMVLQGFYTSAGDADTGLQLK